MFSCRGGQTFFFFFLAKFFYYALCAENGTGGYFPFFPFIVDHILVKNNAHNTQYIVIHRRIHYVSRTSFVYSTFVFSFTRKLLGEQNKIKS